MSTVLVTGTNSGFGRLTVETLARKGHNVFAAMRGVEGKNAAAAKELSELAQKESLKLSVVELDLTSDASVEAAVRKVTSSAGRVDVVVNNAGAVSFGFNESFTPDQVRELFETNVVGIQRLNRAVLPGMREQKSGLLVHIATSIANLPLPLMGVYCASKAAMEVLATTYRFELAAVGVDSVIVEPGAFATGIMSKSMMGKEMERAGGYGMAAQLPQQMGAAMEQMLSGPNSPNPQLVADAVLKLVETPAGQRPLRTVVDPLTGQAAQALNSTHWQIISGMYEMMGMKMLLGGN